MTVVLVDTTVFLNVLDVPGFNQNHDAVVEQLRRRLEERHELLLPIAAIFETGNHIGQLPDGRLRRRTAERFVEQVRKALDGTAPWTPARPIAIADIADWLQGFADHAMAGRGLGDVSIIAEWQRQRLLSPRRRIEIWSLDGHLQGYAT